MTLGLGTHLITATVEDDNGNKDEAKISIDVIAHLMEMSIDGLTVSPDPTTQSDTVVLSFTVIDNDGDPVEGATYSVEVAFPKLELSKTGVTDVDGFVEITYKINTNKTGTGTAIVTVEITKPGYLDGSDTTSFQITKK